MITLSSSGRSDVGRVRRNNEDSLLIADELGLYAVADGVGGRAAGEVASRLAVDTVTDFIWAWRSSPDLDLVGAARAAVEAACHAVFDQAQSTPRLRGMLTTLTIVVLDGDTAAMAHVGDSRLYLARGGRVDRLSVDHTVAAELARQGLISAEGVDDHPFSHALTRAIGEQPSVVVDTLEFILAAGDVLVLATDGLNAVMKEPAAIFAGSESDGELADQLVDAANEGGGAQPSNSTTQTQQGGSGGSSKVARIWAALRDLDQRRRRLRGYRRRWLSLRAATTAARSPGSTPIQACVRVGSEVPFEFSLCTAPALPCSQRKRRVSSRSPRSRRRNGI